MPLVNLSMDDMRLIVSSLRRTRPDGFREVCVKLEIAASQQGVKPTGDELADSLIGMIETAEQERDNAQLLADIFMDLK